MQDSIVDRLKLYWAAKCLNLAETLPDFNGGVIAHLQSIRKRQRERATEYCNQSRPPIGLELNYSRLRLFEMFPIEDFESLEIGLRKLFPEEPLYPDHLENFRLTASSLSRGAFYNVGVLVPSKRGLYMPPVRVLRSLRPEIEAIEVQVIKVLPSIFLVCFSARLSCEATAQVKKVQEGYYLGKVRFRNWLPSLLGGYSQYPPDTTAIEATVGWLNRLRADVEASLRPFCNGFFFKQQTDPNEPALPAIEEFHFQNVPDADQEFEDWLQRSYTWARSLGLDPFPFERYKSKGTMLLLGGSPTIDPPVAHRFLVLRGSGGRAARARAFRPRGNFAIDCYAPITD